MNVQRLLAASLKAAAGRKLSRVTAMSWTVAILVGASGSLSPESARAQKRMIHDPFIFHEDGVYYLLSTGDNIPVKRSQDLWNWRPTGNDGTVFRRPPDWALDVLSRRPARERSMPNLMSPTLYHFNGKYHLYCCVGGLGGSADMCIGLATNTTLDPSDPNYRWVDRGAVLKTTPNVHDFAAMTNVLVRDRQKNTWFLYGGWFSGIKLQRLDPKSGKLMPGQPISLASRRPPALRDSIGAKGIEGPFLHYHDGYWYLFVSFDLCCKGAKSTYSVRVGRSRDIRGPYHDRKGVPMLSGGGTLLIKGYDNVRGPGSTQILVVDGEEFHIGHWYDANENGVPRLSIRPLVWADDGWPLLGEMLTGPYNGPKNRSARELKAAISGKWEHSVSFEPATRFQFLEGGKMTGSPATWELNGNRLTLRFPDPKAPGGVWINQCVLADDGTWYVGRYGPGDGIIIRGRKVR